MGAATDSNSAPPPPCLGGLHDPHTRRKRGTVSTPAQQSQTHHPDMCRFEKGKMNELDTSSTSFGAPESSIEIAASVRRTNASVVVFHVFQPRDLSPKEC